MSKIITQLEQELKGVQNWLLGEFTKISTGRVHPEMLDSVMVSVYGSMQPIKNIASLTVEGPRTLRISPWDSSTLNALETGIRDSGIPLSVSSDSSGIRASVHQLTEETRKDIVKLIGKKHEEARVSVRSEREKSMKEIDALEKSGELNEDEKFKIKEDIQKKVDGINANLENMFKAKEIEVMTIQ